jgi:hypothetical protein
MHTMAQLRRKACDSFLLGAAAEVLELRSLLSAGAAAVHHALHAADHAPSSVISPQTTLPTVSVTVHIDSPTVHSTVSNGSLTITPVTLKKGLHVSIHATAVDGTGPSAITYTANFSGRTTNWSFFSNFVETTLVVAGTLKVKNASGHTIATLKPEKGSTVLLQVFQNTLSLKEIELSFSSHARPPVITDFLATAN